MIKHRLLQEFSHPLKTDLAPMQSSIVATKHCSASAWFPINRNASRYKGLRFFARIAQKSAHVAYAGRGDELSFGRNLCMIDLALACHISDLSGFRLGRVLPSCTLSWAIRPVLRDRPNNFNHHNTLSSQINSAVAQQCQ